MRILYPPHRSGKRGRRTAGGQAMVEFALVFPMLLLVVFGIIELGRLMLIYTSVSAASREAARYASATGISENGLPYYIDTEGIIDAANRVGAFAAPLTVTVNWDKGPVMPPENTPTPWPANKTPTPNEIKLNDRVKVTVSATYNPLMGLTPLRSIPISSSTNRTIIKEVTIDD